MPDRRYAVPFDPDFFADRAAAGEALTPEAAFRHAYRTNLWAGPESPSGPGASLDQTAAIRTRLPDLCRRLAVRTLLDLPCGDAYWMSRIDLGAVDYIGADLLPEIIAANRTRYADARRAFAVLDVTSSTLPRVDLLLCRDLLVHLSFADIASALDNILASGSTWLLTTTFTAQDENRDIRTGDWRPLNLEAPPFDWPAPRELLVEECTEGAGAFEDKSLGLWRVDELSP